MKRRQWIQWASGYGLAALAGTTGATEKNALQWAERHFNALGTSLHLKAAHEDPARAAAALDACVADVRQIESEMSLFKEDSALQHLNRSGVLEQPPPNLVQLLTTAQQISKRSRGDFDVTVQPLWSVFEQAAKLGKIPDPTDVAKARALVDWRQLTVTPQRIALQHPGMGVTLNGIAQGFAADKLKARLQQHKIAHALVDAGEWSALGLSPANRDWVLGVANPRQSEAVLGRIALNGACLATSADDQCSFSQDHQYHHIFNPHTGYSPPDLCSVTVLARNASLADAMTKVLFMAGFDQGLRVAEQWGVQAVLVHKQGHIKTSPGLRWLAA